MDSNHLDPDSRAFIQELGVKGVPALYTLDPASARQVFVDVQSDPVAKLEVDIEERILLVGPTGSVKIKIFRPVGARPRLPVIVYMHGGGWVLGGVNTHDRLVREITSGVHAAVVFVEYTLAPEARFPVQNEQAYGVIEHIAANGKDLNLDGSRLALAGDSSGGTMVAALSIMAKVRRGPEIALQVMFYPVTDYPSQNESYRRYANGPWLTEATMKWFLDQVGLTASMVDLATYPLRAPIEDLQGLPETVVIVAENDILRDEGEEFARRLSQAGVRVTSTRYNGTIHDFVVLNALAGAPPTVAAIQQAIDALNRAIC